MTTDHRARLGKTAGYYAAFIALGLTSASLGPTLSGLAANTGTAISQISILFTARAFGYLLGSLLGGRLFDRMRGHPVMALMVAGMVASMALAPGLNLLWLLAGAILLIGVAEGVVDVGGNTLIVWVHRGDVGPYMNGLHFFYGVGAFISPLIVGQVLLRSGGDITWAYWIVALLMLPVVLYIARQPSPVNQDVVEKDSAAKPASPTLVALIALFIFLYVGAEISFGGWIYTYAVALGLATPAAAAYLTSGFWGALTVGRLLAIPLAARFRPRTILLVDLLGCMAAVGLILVYPASLTVAWVGSIGAGLFMASVFPTTLSLAERRMPITGQVTSWFFVGASLGSMTVPYIIGQLFESTGPVVTMIAILICLVLAVGVYTRVVGWQKK
ncbi:MAG: MFS transporter [Caldilineaceae bacterium]|nr:MFS transporter [Caldilineaceae bacterium]MBP8109568.1 MFS transporter [Caldilineaceae bacterium]MBP8124068.1 MFS transporter [Caldilineaceae bacterium]MBP9074440.1 MFS transporter [Caldilineaceae bacterium]